MVGISFPAGPPGSGDPFTLVDFVIIFLFLATIAFVVSRASQRGRRGRH